MAVALLHFHTSKRQGDEVGVRPEPSTVPASSRARVAKAGPPGLAGTRPTATRAIVAGHKDVPAVILGQWCEAAVRWHEVTGVCPRLRLHRGRSNLKLRGEQ
jgi:hypothetical protein